MVQVSYAWTSYMVFLILWLPDEVAENRLQSFSPMEECVKYTQCQSLLGDIILSVFDFVCDECSLIDLSAHLKSITDDNWRILIETKKTRKMKDNWKKYRKGVINIVYTWLTL